MVGALAAGAAAVFAGALVTRASDGGRSFAAAQDAQYASKLAFAQRFGTTPPRREIAEPQVAVPDVQQASGSAGGQDGVTSADATTDGQDGVVGDAVTNAAGPPLSGVLGVRAHGRKADTPTPTRTAAPPPTATRTATPAPATATRTTAAATATSTATKTSVPSTSTNTATSTAVPPTNTNTATSTPVPATSTSTPTRTPVPAPTATVGGSSSSWTGAYYNNTLLSGTPALTRADAAIDFSWPNAPAAGVNADYFSVRWSKSATLPAGRYTFSVTHDDGARIYVDGQLIIDNWYPQVPTSFTRDVDLSAGPHTLTMEYYHTWGGAVADLTITAASGAAITEPAAATNTPAPAASTATWTSTPTPTPVLSGTVAPAATATRTSTATPTFTRTATALPALATATPTPQAAAGSRNKYQWPFASNSIWNMPIGSSAVYVPAGIQPANGWGGAITTDDEFIGLNPADALRTLTWPGGSAQVRVPAGVTHDGSWNGVSAFLGTDGNTVYQGQPLVAGTTGNISWDYNYPAVNLYGDGIDGAHGGSGLSSFGGSIRKGELSSAAPLRHALKVNLFAQRFLSCQSGGYRWPARRADAYMNCTTYGGGTSALRMGSLLALKPTFNCATVGSVRARKICQALQDYGAYVVDDTYWDVHAIDIEAGAEFSDGGSFDSDLQYIFTQLNVVDNNSATNIGGGGTPRVPMAPPISN